MNIYKKYYLEKQEILSILQNGIIAFDTSALLSLHNFSENTRNEIFNSILTQFSHRLCLPSQVHFEFLKNEKKVIDKPVKSYDSLISERNNGNGYLDKIDAAVEELGKEELEQIQGLLNTLMENTKKTDKHPYLEQEIFVKYLEKVKRINEEINSFKKDSQSFSEEVKGKIRTQQEVVRNDTASLEDAVNRLFDISEELDYKEYKRIIEEGRIRYADKMAPGFEDAKDKDGLRKYGDLIVWKEIIAIGKARRKNLLLITHDRKKDWWDKELNAPSYDLLKEYAGETGYRFWSCDIPTFLELVKQLNNERDIVSDKVLEESKNVIFEEEISYLEDETCALYTDVLNNWLENEMDLRIERMLPKNQEWRTFGKHYIYLAHNYENEPCIAVLNIVSSVTYASVLHAFKNIHGIRRFYESFGKDYKYYQFVVLNSSGKIEEIEKLMKEKTKLYNLFYKKKEVENTLLYLENGELQFVSANHPMG